MVIVGLYSNADIQYPLSVVVLPESHLRVMFRALFIARSDDAAWLSPEINNRVIPYLRKREQTGHNERI